MSAAELSVVAAAIYQDGALYSLPAPARHHDVMWHIREIRPELRVVTGEQGFLLSDGRFARRVPAKRIAERAGQLRKEPLHPRELFSEDLW